MSVKKETSGRRSVQLEVEVPGTPEEVWQAIATGPGISSWFMPTKFEERDGRPVAVTSSFGPGMEPRSAGPPGPASYASCGSTSHTSAANAPRSCSSWRLSREPKPRHGKR